MPLLDIMDPVQFRTYLLVLIRISILLYMFPVFSSNVFPASLKMGFVLVLSLLFYSVVPVDLDRFPMDVVSTGLLIAMEAMVGMMMGLCVRIFFGSVQLAGQVIGFQIGFAMINVLDPQSGSNVSIMDQLGYWICVVVFLLADGHHVMISAVIESFELVPLGGGVLHKAALVKIMGLVANLFRLAIKVGAPVIAALLFVSVGFGLVSKFSPQMNVMIMAFPLKIAVGLALFAFTLEIISIVTRNYVAGLKKILLYLLYFAGGG
ncbi:MAG: flagellar biosynthetic protein FliR [Desulfovibrionales bacterium]|nr:flagellar biosynthetic protein FliR [Desulfovibrionales bacterium]